MTKSLSDLTDKILIGTGIILVFFTLCVTWSIPRGAGDLYISLAAGRDVVAGKLGAPDDWSFSTNGRVWINQNWGSNLILYLVVSAWGSTGLLAVKFLLLIVCALFLILALHEREIPPAVNLVITSVIIVSVNVYAVLRPNLFTFPLAALELWLLFKSAKHRFYLWMAVLVILFWANVHAGFIYGLGMLCLWTICRIVPELRKKNRGVLRHNWQLPAAVAAAIVLAGLVNPFGLRNLTLPFTMLQGSAWNITQDWQPLWKTDMLAGSLSSILSYLGLVCATLLLLGLRLARLRSRAASPMRRASSDKQSSRLRSVASSVKQSSGLHSGASSNKQSCRLRSGDQAKLLKNDDKGSQDWQNILFETLLALVTLVMAVFSNRFIILALIALAPLLAGQLAWLCRNFRYYRLLLAAVFGFVLVYGVLILYDNSRSYDPRNPVMNTGTGTLFEKMHYTNREYGSELIRFINTNRISGHVYSPWKWEGYLRWNCPQLQPFIGGRAQQIYSMEALNQYLYTTGFYVPAYHSKAPEDVLNMIDAHFLIAGNTSDSESIVLTALNSGNWIIVYADARVLLFANTRRQHAAAVVSLLTEDKLLFENEATRAMSKAACLLSQPVRWQTGNLLSLFAEAWKHEPRWLWSYWMLYNNLGFNADLQRELVRLMEEQLARLEAMNLDGADADDILQCRIYLAGALAEYAGSQNLPAMASEKKRSLDDARQWEAALYRKWKAITR